MQVAVVILALVVAGAIVGGATVLGAPVFALPIVAALLAGWAAVAVGRRALRRGPERRQRVRFTEADRATLLPSASESERRANRQAAARRG